MQGKWAYKKYISFNNFTAKKAKEQKIKIVRREIKAKRVQRPPPKPVVTVPKEKDALIRSIQIRWWYLLPDWPESDVDYTPSLLEKGLKLVPDRELSSDVRETGVVDRVKTVGGFPLGRLFQREYMEGLRVCVSRQEKSNIVKSQTSLIMEKL